MTTTTRNDLLLQKPPLKEQVCPQCQAAIPVYDGFTTWCDRCGWNLDVLEPSPFESLLDRLYRSIGRTSSHQR